MMRESEIEAYLLAEIARIGGMCEKFVSPQRRFVPDRLVTFMGYMYMVELKREGVKPNAGQVRDHYRRSRQGVFVHVVDSCEKVDRFIKTLVEDANVF